MSRTMRILCLHGSQQTKETFRSRVGKLPQKAKHVAEFTFIDAPHELPMKEGDDVATRTWWRYDLGEDVRKSTMLESFACVERAWRELGPFDGVLGFSMGGALACSMAARANDFPGLRFVFVGGAPCVENDVVLWGDFSNLRITLPSFHAFGVEDKVVDMSSSKKLASHFEDPVLMEHSQGHCFPTRREAFDQYVGFLEKMHTMMHLGSKETSEKPSEIVSSATSDGKDEEIICESEESAQEQRDELEALLSIYVDKLEILKDAPQGAGEPCCRLRADISTEQMKIFLTIQLPADYPGTLPIFKVEHNLDMLQFPVQAEKLLVGHISHELSSQMGMPCVYSAISAAEEWLSDSNNINSARASASKQPVVAPPTPDEGQDEDGTLGDVRIWEEEDDEKESEMIRIATEEACENVRKRLIDNKNDLGKVALAKGVKKFIVGLVGKPSAGKSTFFNCVTRLQNEAKVAAHPFTTIEPNFGTGWWVSVDEDDRLLPKDDHVNQEDTRHGRDAQGRRLLPLLVKDVAGLIPGAYKGQGKGNRFLNDLCDADVLIHVVDVSGSCDKNGVAVLADDASASTAAQDIKWVREELHRWIFGNVSAKWRSVVRYHRASEKAAEDRLMALFSGYQGSRSAVKAAAFRANLDLSYTIGWTRQDLHRLVAHFLSVRFPMCLALNKADRVFADPKTLQKIQDAKDNAAQQGYLAVTCSAMTETTLLALSKTGGMEYDLGGREFNVKDQTKCLELFKNDERKFLNQLENAKRVFTALGGTGVLECVTQAVLLRQPVLVYPVSDVKTGAPILGRQANKSKDANTPFRDCLQALPGSSVDDIFTALKRGIFEEYRLDGDFIRAEATFRNPGGVIRQIGKETQIDNSCCVLKILTNKKPVWQQK